MDSKSKLELENKDKLYNKLKHHKMEGYRAREQ